MDRLSKARQIRAMLHWSAQDLPDNRALQVPDLYDVWKPDADYNAPCIVRRGGQLYRLISATHHSQADWPPELVPAIWTPIALDHAGTIDDPIPAVANMQYYAGKHYLDGGVIYLCIRDTGQPVAQLPSRLINIYFTEV